MCDVGEAGNMDVQDSLLLVRMVGSKLVQDCLGSLVLLGAAYVH